MTSAKTFTDICYLCTLLPKKNISYAINFLMIWFSPNFQSLTQISGSSCPVDSLTNCIREDWGAGGLRDVGRWRFQQITFERSGISNGFDGNFNCSLSVENIKEPILMEDVKVTESRITQGSQRNVSYYEQSRRLKLPPFEKIDFHPLNPFFLQQIILANPQTLILQYFQLLPTLEAN